MKKSGLMSLIVLAAVILASCGGFIDDYGTPTTESGGVSIPRFEDTVIYKNDNRFSYEKSDDDISSTLSERSWGHVVNTYRDEDLILMQFGTAPYKYNEKTGELTSVCVDPLCRANEERCPFNEMTSLCRYHNGMYFYEVITGLTQVGYDPETNTVREMWKGQEGYGILIQVFDGDWCYYYTIEENDVGSDSSEWIVAFNRQNIYNGKIEVIEETEGFNYSLILVTDERYYFEDLRNGGIFYTPVDDIENRTYIIDNVTSNYIFDKNCMYFIESFDDGTKTLSSIGYDGEDYINYETPDVYGIETVSVTNKYICYMNDDPTYVKIDGETERRNSPEIWRIDKATGEKELALTLSGDLQYISIEQFIVKGRYLYADFDMVTDEYCYGVRGRGVLRIDIETGAWYYISPEKVS